MTGKARGFVSYRVGWLLVGIAIAGGILAAFVLAGAVGPAIHDTFFRHPCATPCSEELGLDSGSYLVFEEIGHSRSVGPFSSSTTGPATITPADVAVTSPSGSTLTVSVTDFSETIDRNGTTYGGVVSFHVPQAGRYRVSVDAPNPTHVLVAPGIGQTLKKALPGIAIGGLGSLVGVGGLVVLILAWTRRRSATATAAT